MECDRYFDSFGTGIGSVSYRRILLRNQFKPILWTNAGVIWAIANGIVTVWRVKQT